MGSGNSREVPPQMVGSVNILITKEVTDRWQAIQQKKQQINQEKMDSAGLNRAAGDAGTRDDSDINQNRMKAENGMPLLTNVDVDCETQLSLKAKAENSASGPEVEAKSTGTSSSPILNLGKIIIPTNDPPKKDTDTDVTSTKITDSRSATTEGEDYSNMNKLISHFLVHNDAPKRHEDIENGNVDDLNYFTDPDGRFSALMPEQRKPTSIQSHEPFEDSQYEEVDETAKNKSGSSSHADPKEYHDQFVDEEMEQKEIKKSIILSPPNSTKKDTGKGYEVKIPRHALPVVIDQDDMGRPRFETIASWKVRDEADKAVAENNQYWREELERITATVYDETRMEAENFQNRLRQLDARYPNLYSTSHLPGSHCNMLTSQISKCYEANPGQVLKCSGLVRQFAQCANNVILKQYGNGNDNPVHG